MSLTFPAAIELIAQARRIVGFTGAGISTESGIPDFRSPGGVWANNRIVEYQEFVSSRVGREEAWRQKVMTWPEMREAQPNAGHRAFVELEKRRQLIAMITQNIDGLHQRAGHDPKTLIELHGTMLHAVCLSCGDKISMDEAVARVQSGELAPECETCGGYLKTATISFGQSMPEREMNHAYDATDHCDVFIVAGSSLVVYPAASLPAIAKQNGAKLIIINRTETPLDEYADLVVRDAIGIALPKLVGME